MNPIPEVFTVQEEDGRWLSWCDNPKVASYGITKEDSLEKTYNCLEHEDLSLDEDIEELMVIPQLDDNQMVGVELLKLVIKWTGHTEEEWMTLQEETEDED
jgi:hypothetical protein